MITDSVEINKKCIREILHNNFDKQKVYATILRFEQQEARKKAFNDTLNAIIRRTLHRETSISFPK